MKQNAKIIKCGGEAHENPYIDNCMCCAPFWGKIVMCPAHNIKLSKTGYCNKCKKYYEVPE